LSSHLPIIGHTKQQQQLALDLERDCISQAYLFAGVPNVGKMTLARWFAGSLVTEGLEEEEAGQQLQQIRKNIHPDILTLDQLWIDNVCTDWNIIARSSNVPQQHRAKNKVKTDTIGIDDVRSIQERMYETASRKRRCCIIRSIERLHITAANALLKILEEPPANATFLFTTQSLSNIPETILSRMRIVKMHPVPATELQPLLKDHSDEDVSLILDVAQGAPGIVQRCISDPETLRYYRQMAIHAKNFLETSTPAEQLSLLTELIEKKETKNFFRALLIRLRKKLRSEDEQTVRVAIQWMEDIQELLRQLQSNAHKQLVLRNFVLNRSLTSAA
jgi:DNA polymerase III delta prime subunit